MFEQMALRRATERANQRISQGDTAGAREEISGFLDKHPRSVQGWALLHAAVSSDNGTIEDRLDVMRAAANAIPYEIRIVDYLVHELIRACVAIGDTGYLDEAERVITAHEDVLGVSPHPQVLRALIEQFRGNDVAAVELCGRANDALEHHPDPSVTFRIGMCLSSIDTHQARGIALAEEAARRTKRSDYLLTLAVALEDRDAAKAGELLASARAASRGASEEQIDQDVERVRDELRRQREFLAEARAG